MLALWIGLVANILGMTVLVCLVYFRRHFRRDLALAYIALSMGIFAVTLLLSESEARLGLGSASLASCRSFGCVPLR